MDKEKVTKEKSTPHRRTPGILPYVFVLGGRWSTDAHPCAFVDWPHPCGHTSCCSRPPITAAQGPQPQQKRAPGAQQRQRHISGSNFCAARHAVCVTLIDYRLS